MRTHTLKLVYVLEDVKMLSYSYQHHLGKDYELVIFDTPEEFLAVSSSKKPDLVILDYRYPNSSLSGYEVVSRLRARYEDLPIILVSGNITNEIIIRLSEFRVNKFMDKPVEMFELKKAVDSIFNATYITPRCLLRKKIAVLEDVKILHLFYKLALSNSYDLVCVSNLSELKVVEHKEDFVLVIMDYHIQHDNFNENLLYIRRNFPNAKRVLISGVVEVLGLDQKYKTDFSGFFTKPLEHHMKFREQIEEVLLK